MFCVILENKLNKIIVYFQHNSEFGFSIQRNSFYVDLKFTEQNELNFPFDNDHNTQNITQVNNWDI